MLAPYYLKPRKGSLRPRIKAKRGHVIERHSAGELKDVVGPITSGSTNSSAAHAHSGPSTGFALRRVNDLVQQYIENIGFHGLFFIGVSVEHLSACIFGQTSPCLHSVFPLRTTFLQWKSSTLPASCRSTVDWRPTTSSTLEIRRECAASTPQPPPQPVDKISRSCGTSLGR